MPLFAWLTPTKYFLGLTAICGGLGAIITFSNMPLWYIPLHLAHWGIHSFGLLTVLVLVQIGLSKSAFLLAQSPWVQLLISAVIGALLFAPLSLWGDRLFEGRVFLTSFGQEWIKTFLDTVPIITLCWLTLNAPWVLSNPLKRRNEKLTATESNEPAFFALLPHGFDKNICLLKSNLHYLQVRNTSQTTFILYDVKTASKELHAYRNH